MQKYYDDLRYGTSMMHVTTVSFSLLNRFLIHFVMMEGKAGINPASVYIPANSALLLFIHPRLLLLRAS
jgi:hypothetical protein